MRGFLFVIYTVLLYSLTSCNSYQHVILTDFMTLRNEDSSIRETIEKGASVYISKRKNSRGMYIVKYGHNGSKKGWTFSSRHIQSTSSYHNSLDDDYIPYNYIPSYYYTTPSSGKTVNVRGYYRKDGTYVRPHTRSAPRRR